MLVHHDTKENHDYPVVTVKWLDVFYCVLALTCVIILCYACSPKYTATEAVKQINKANDKFPDTTAYVTRKLYPCIESGKSVDSSQYLTVKNRLDAVMGMYLKEKNKVPIRITQYIKDTAKCVEECNAKIDGWKQLTDLQEVTIADLKNQIIDLQNHPVTITKKIEDSAKTRMMQGEVNRVEYLLQKSTEENTEKNIKIEQLQNQLKDAKASRNKAWMYFSMLALIIGLFVGWRVKKKLSLRSLITG